MPANSRVAGASDAATSTMNARPYEAVSMPCWYTLGKSTNCLPGAGKVPYTLPGDGSTPSDRSLRVAGASDAAVNVALGSATRPLTCTVAPPPGAPALICSNGCVAPG